MDGARARRDTSDHTAERGSEPTSTDFNDFWGLHVWTGAVTEPPWTDPVRPVGQDVFGIVFRIDLVDEADQLAYILHRGDTKDPGPDQFLVFASTATRCGSFRAQIRRTRM